MESPEKISPPRTAALIALAIGAVGCEYLMFRVGRRNPSALLMAMFAAWVLAPFAALAWCHLVAQRWSASMRVLLHAVSLLMAIISLMVYSYVAFGPPRSQPAFFFLVVPTSSLIVIAVLVVCAGKRENA